MTKIKVLYLYPGLDAPSKDKQLSKFFALSEISRGVVLSPVWWRNGDEQIRDLGEENYPDFVVGDYKFLFCYLSHVAEQFQFLFKIVFFIREGLRLNKEFDGFDYIMTYGTNSTGLAALFLRLFTKAKLITEIPGVPEDGALYDEPKASLKTRFQLKICNLFLNLVLLKTDILKLLYENQLDFYPLARGIPKAVFHDFVPTNSIQEVDSIDGKYLIAIGHPWYRKGFDVLIKAFIRIQDEIPEIDLKIVGWLPDRKYLDSLIKDNSRIAILPPQPKAEIFKLIANSFALVLPSRSEAMGRVLLEAMALEKPLLGSRINGIPTYLIHEKNGLLSEVGDEVGLADNILRLYHDKDLRTGLGSWGFDYLNNELSERAYVDKFKLMLNLTS